MSQIAAFSRSVIFFVIQAALTVVWSILSLLTFPFPALVRYRIITAWSRLVVWLASALCGVRYRVLGLDNLPKQASIVLAKHQSAWETLAFEVFLPPQVWVLRRSLLRVPFFGWGLAMMNPIAIDRASGIAAQLIAMKRFSLLALDWWSALASISLPVPLSPRRMTVASDGATFSTLRHTFNTTGSRVITPVIRECVCVCSSLRFSCCNACK